jgi:pantoate--beta-alanine ligase
MRTVRTVAELRDALRELPRPLGLVPTMGAFHEGHLSLVRRARDESASVVVSLFVNPAQFGPNEDFDAYPRDEERDARLAEEEGVDILFAPGVDEIYPPDHQTYVVMDGIATILEAEERGTSHFRGVITVVTKLFNMVGPDSAYFGQKDAQQVLIIRKLVRDLNFPVEIVVCPTIREPDGLALSSRNVYLTGPERERATALSRSLRAADEAVESGEHDPDRVLAVARAVLDQAGIEPEYLELRSLEDLSPVERVNGSTLLAVAARVGKARLIDNAILGGT